MSLNKYQALSLAKEYVLQRNVRAAIDIYREIIEADPTDLTAINTLGDLYASTGLAKDAMAQFSRVADGYIASGLTRKAIATLKKMIAADPANTTAAIKLADMYAKAGLPSEARQHYVRIAGSYTQKGETREALHIYSKIVDLDPSNPPARIKLGELYLCEGMNEQAYESFMVAAEQLANKGEIRRALNIYYEALSIKPDSVDTLAAVDTLTAVLGIDQDKGRRGPVSQTAASDNLADEDSSTLTASALPAAPTPLYPENPDDLLVVQEISKAERLVAYGRVNQAISMLKDVLTNKPDNIDVHIKLKDICLRTGMMAEAAEECGELVRIYLARGEQDRARDYQIRAKRLIQLIERPSGDLQQPERKPVEAAEPRANAGSIKLAPPFEPDPKSSKTASPLDGDRAQLTRTTLSVVPPAAITTEPPTITADLAPALNSEYVESPPPVSETIVELEPARALEAALDQDTGSSNDAIACVLPSLSFGTPPVERNRARLRAASIAATVLALGLAGTVIGGFAYNAHLDKQYEALALASPPLIEPSSPPLPVSEPEQVQEDEPIMVDVAPSLQTETSTRLQKPEPEAIKKEQPAPPQSTSEPPKVTTRPSPLLPRTAVNADSLAYTENRVPAGLAGDVPVTATHPAEPPPRAVRQSPGIVSGVAVKKVDPVYPKAAREALQTGVVAVEITINEQGNVTSARALSGPALLRNAAVLAARAWKFKPSSLGGVPVTTTSTITFNFKL